MSRRQPQDFSADRRKGRWEALTGWMDDAIDEEAEEADERPTSDGDVLGEVTAGAARRRRLTNATRDPPLEDQWKMDVDAFTSPRVRAWF
jgi:WD repeat-containing protein 48